MNAKSRFHRLFLMMKQEDGGYGAGQAPTGYVKIEARDNKGKLTAMVQNLKDGRDSFGYRLYILKLQGDTVIAADAGLFPESGNSREITWQFDPDNVATTGQRIEGFDAAVVLVEYRTAQNTGIVCPLAAFRKPLPGWREKLRKALHSAGSRSVEPKASCGNLKSGDFIGVIEAIKGSEIIKGSEAIKGGEVIRDSEAIKDGEVVKSCEVIQGGENRQEENRKGESRQEELPEAKEFFAEYINSRPEDNNSGGRQIGFREPEGHSGGDQGRPFDVEGQLGNKDISNEPEGPGGEGAGNSRQEEPGNQGRHDVSQGGAQQSSAVEPGISENERIPGADVPGISGNEAQHASAHEDAGFFEEADKGGNAGMFGRYRLMEDDAGEETAYRGPTGIQKLKECLDRYFESYEPFHVRRRDYRWWRFSNPVQLNDILFQCDIRTPLLFNPVVMMANFKYRHLIIGIYTDRARGREYIVCGVPGAYGVDERPFGNLCRWVQLEGRVRRYGALGYWLVYIDPKTGKFLGTE